MNMNEKISVKLMERYINFIMKSPMYLVLPIVAILMATDIGRADGLNPNIIYKLVDLPLVRIIILSLIAYFAIELPITAMALGFLYVIIINDIGKLRDDNEDEAFTNKETGDDEK